MAGYELLASSIKVKSSNILLVLRNDPIRECKLLIMDYETYNKHDR